MRDGLNASAPATVVTGMEITAARGGPGDIP